MSYDLPVDSGGSTHYIVQPMISCIAVLPPVPPVNPTYAVFPPTVVAMLIGHVCVHVAFVVVSVICIVKLVPL